jgi:hypothetical protein
MELDFTSHNLSGGLYTAGGSFGSPAWGLRSEATEIAGYRRAPVFGRIQYGGYQRSKEWSKPSQARKYWTIAWAIFLFN